MKNPIIILHGWRLDSFKYTGLVNIFKKQKYKVFAPDLPGFGKKKHLEKALNLDDYVEFLKDYIDSKKLKQPIIIAHSFGGRVALKYTSKNNDRVKKLILTGVPGFVPVAKTKRLVFLLLSKAGKVVCLLPPFCFFRPLWKKILYKVSGSSDYLYATGFLKDTFQSVIRENLLPYMEKINVPTLLLWGEADKVVDGAVAKKMNQVIKKSKLEFVKDAKHSFLITKPKIFATFALKFLEK